ncbi:MAG: glycosyltransferase family 4 protein [Bacteroidia bacterium]
MKILVLYEELAWYFVNCLNVLAAENKVEILVFCKTSNPVAPFEFKAVHPSITLKDRSALSERDLQNSAAAFSPDYILLAGWSYKPYVDFVKKNKAKRVIIGFDNQWEGTLRQRLGALYFRFFLKPHIHKAFVPGPKQAGFAERLGFSEQNIVRDAYCCDYDSFNAAYQSAKEKKQSRFPKRFLFVGRYAPEKGIDLLWNAFIQLQTETPSGWELWCFGKGNVKAKEHPQIRHFGFVQPEQLLTVIESCGVFVLPSLFEPWGVVVHEYATAGYPLICSDKVGSAGKFLIDGVNGFSVRAGDAGGLKEKLKLFMQMSDEKLNLMSEKSHELGAALQPQMWAHALMTGFLR